MINSVKSCEISEGQKDSADVIFGKFWMAPLWIAELRTVTDSNSNLEKGQYCQYRISKIHNEVKIFINPHVDFYPSSNLWDIFWTNSLIYRVKSCKIAEVWNNSDPILK